MRTTRLISLLAIVAATVLPSSRLTAEDMGTNAAEVKIDNFCFTPQTLTVSVGTTVTWINKDDIPHTVTSDVKLFTSRALDTDQTFSFKFSASGTNNYYCSMHPKMLGTVIVK